MQWRHKDQYVVLFPKSNEANSIKANNTEVQETNGAQLPPEMLDRIFQLSAGPGGCGAGLPAEEGGGERPGLWPVGRQGGLQEHGRQNTRRMLVVRELRVSRMVSRG